MMYYILIAVYIIIVTILLLIKECLGTKIFFIFCITFLLFMILPLVCDDIKVVQSVKIYSLYNNSEIKGKFILGSGSINQEEYYYFFTKKDNAYYKEKVSNKTGIIETDKTPKLEETTIYPKIWYGQLFEIRQYKLYVPKGTIIKEFKVR